MTLPLYLNETNFDVINKCFIVHNITSSAFPVFRSKLIHFHKSNLEGISYLHVGPSILHL